MVATRKQTEKQGKSPAPKARGKSPARGTSKKQVQINEDQNQVVEITDENNTNNTSNTNVTETPVVINAQNVNVNSAQQPKGFLEQYENISAFGIGWHTAGGLLGLTTGLAAKFTANPLWVAGSIAVGAGVQGTALKYGPRAAYNAVAYGPGYAKQAFDTVYAYTPSRETIYNGAIQAKDATVSVLTFLYNKCPSIRKGAKPAEVVECTKEFTAEEVIALVAHEMATQKTAEPKKSARKRK